MGGWEGRMGGSEWEGRVDGSREGVRWGLFFFCVSKVSHLLVPMCIACVVTGQNLPSTCPVTPYSSSIAESFSVILVCYHGLKGRLLVHC